MEKGWRQKLSRNRQHDKLFFFIKTYKISQVNYGFHFRPCCEIIKPAESWGQFNVWKLAWNCCSSFCFPRCTRTVILRGDRELMYLPIQKGFLPLKSHSHCMCCSLATLARLPRYLDSRREDRVIRIPQSDRQLPSTYQRGALILV